MERVATTIRFLPGCGRTLRTGLLSTIVLFGAVTPLCVGADGFQGVAPASQNLADVTRLPADSTLERDLSHRDEHRYAVALTADEYVDVRVERRGVDVIVQARGIGDQLLEFQHDVGTVGEESFELVAGGAGATYILTLTAAPGTVVRGSYAIR